MKVVRQSLRLASTAAVAAATAALLGALAGCRCGDVELVAEFPKGQGALEESFRLVTWNVRKGLDPRLRHDLLGLVQKEQPDLLLVQEGTADLLRESPLGGFFGKGWRYPWPKGDAVGVMSFSRVRPLEKEVVATRHREFFMTAPKEALLTKYALPGGESLLIANIHALCFERWSLGHYRAQFEDLQKKLAAHDGPLILGGDLNTWNPRRLAIVEEVARSLGLEEVSAFPQTRTTGDRGSAIANWVCGVDSMLPLDRIYLRGLEVEALSVLEEYRSSDHLPLFVVLRPSRAVLAQRLP